MTWREVYRWYDTRYLGTRNLVLERSAGGELPDKPAELADLCQPKHKQRARVEKSSFGGPGANSYSPYREVEFFRAAP